MRLTFAKQNKKFLIKRVTSYVISQPNMKPVTVLEKICFKEVFYTHPNMAKFFLYFALHYTYSLTNPEIHENTALCQGRPC